MQRIKLLKSSIFKFTLIYTAVFGLSVAIPFAVIYDSTVASVDRETNAAIVSELRALGDDFERLGIASLIEIINERSLDPADRDAVYLLVDKEFQPLAGNILEWPKERIADKEWLRFDLQVIEAGQATTHRIRSRIMPLTGGAYLLVGRDMQQRKKVQQSASQAIVWALALALGIGLPGGVLLSRWVLRRVERIAETTREINQGALHRRMPVGVAGDEFDRLSESLNTMLDRIEQLMTGMRTVTDSVAHDLRGPLTHLRGRIELALRGAPNMAAYRAALQTALAESDRILEMFNALVAVAQAESGVTRNEMKTIDLAALARGAAELYEPVAEDKGLDFQINGPPDLYVHGHRQFLAQAVANLLDNAIKYTPPGGRITLGVRPVGDHVELSVADSGPGIPQGDRARALERFVRVGEGETPGYGLGLSLVAAVARLHEAPLGLEDNQPGLRVTLTFARAAASALRQAAAQ